MPGVIGGHHFMDAVCVRNKKVSYAQVINLHCQLMKAFCTQHNVKIAPDYEIKFTNS